MLQNFKVDLRNGEKLAQFFMESFNRDIGTPLKEHHCSEASAPDDWCLLAMILQVALARDKNSSADRSV